MDKSFYLEIKKDDTFSNYFKSGNVNKRIDRRKREI